MNTSGGAVALADEDEPGTPRATVVPDTSRYSLSITCPISGARRFVRERPKQGLSAAAASTGDENLLSEAFPDILAAIEPLLNFINTKNVPRLYPSRLRPGNGHVDGRLWVDKYAPKNFTQLLGDAATNRGTLRWLHQWRDYLKSPERHAPPEIPILLIAGTPGIGKTTLATVLAEHAGFRSLHINASDDRSARSLKERVKEAMSVRTIDFNAGGAPSRSNCIILDEIDGALSGSDASNGITALVSLLQPKRGKSRHEVKAPVIAICNDLYAKVLRPLRRIAQVFTYSAPSQQDLRTRVREIARCEGIPSSLDSAIDVICEASHADVRCALNTLQFLQRLSPKRTQSTTNRYSAASPVLLEYPALTVVGIKDSPTNAFDIWRAIFSQPKSSTRFGTSVSPTVQQKQSLTSLRERLELADNRHILDGCYENFLRVAAAHDRGMPLIVASLDMHSSVDSMALALEADYREYVVLSYRLRFALLHNRLIKFIMPNQGTGSTTETILRRRELDTVRRNIIHGVTLCNASLSLRELVLLCAPFLVLSLSASNRSVSSENKSPAGSNGYKELISGMVEKLSAYGFRKARFLQKLESNSGIWRWLEPDLCKGVQFNLTEETKIKEQLKERKLLFDRDVLPSGVTESIPDLLETASVPGVVSPKRKTPVPTGRKKEVVTVKREQLPVALRSKLRTRYQFNEGHTLAVRRPIHLEMLL